ncbi:DUF4430 domain-containing protein [Paenibacillus psychroresistens]|uniref:DUF4430 domain-containing protein n=2 Tax=Paenibacillus psychroresistens TaxID=1778678 RepID=A0A6B8RY31_9BACL|nr:DUF4430 domain-containing protein [Paenibacillus psychroresistens]
MEYKLDSADYVIYNAAVFNAIDLSDNHTLLVRIPADENTGTPAGLAATLFFTPTPGAPAAPNVTMNDMTNIVTGLTAAMEYKLDSADYVRYNAAIFNGIDLSGSHTLLVRIPANENTGASPGLAAALIFTPTPEAPAEPNVTLNDIKNIVTGLTTVMEYKLDNADYVMYNAAVFNAIDLRDSHTLLVRISANENTGAPAGLAVTLTFTPTPDPPAAPILKLNDITNIVTGLTTAMEYKLDKADYVVYNAAVFNAIDLSDNHTLLVRIPADENTGVPAGIAASLIFNPTPGAPAAPNVTINDLTNVVAGLTTSMEYKLDSAAFVIYDEAVFNTIDLNGRHTILVRIPADENTGAPAGLSAILTFTEIPVAPAAPNVTLNDLTNVVTGLTITMEYKLDSADYVMYNAALFNTIDLSDNHTLLVRIPADENTGAPAGLNATLIFTPTPIAPAAPNVTLNDITNIVTGITTEMEYKLDSADYVIYNAAVFNSIDLSGSHTMLVRIPANENTGAPAGHEATLIFRPTPAGPIATPSPVAPLAPNVTLNDITNIVTGLTTAMEYKLDSAAYIIYNAAVFNALDLSGSHTLLVRVPANENTGTPAGLATTLIFTPVKPEEPTQPDLSKDIVVSLPNTYQPKVDIPLDDRNYVIPITTADSNKEITVEIPTDKLSKVSVNLPLNSNLPKLEAAKGEVSIVIPKGTRALSGDTSAVELLSSTAFSDTELKDKLSTIMPNGKKLDSIIKAFSMGGNARVEFSQFVLLTFTGMRGKDAAFIQNGSPYAIQKYPGDLEGVNSGKDEYAFENGNDLIVKTKHFTDYIAYNSSEAAETPPDNGGGTAPTPNMNVTLSVDKVTIKKGFVVSPTTVELETGDTAWSVLKRVLDSRGIAYRSQWYDGFGSIYVQSIAGDGEFDNGSGSGWMYNVNGVYPNYGSSDYVLMAGDSLQWRYTISLGEDLGVPLPSNGEAPTTPASNVKSPVFEVPKDIQTEYTLDITKELKNTNQITFNIPKGNSKVFLDLKDVTVDIPRITATKGDISVTIDKGTQLKAGDPKLEYISTIDPSDTTILNLIKGSLSTNTKLAHINNAFNMGSTTKSTLFNKPLTLIIKGGKGQLPGYLENNQFTPIQIYETEEAGQLATEGNEKITYAFVKDNELIIKTNHFTSFVSYTTTTTTTKAEADSVKPIDLKQLYSDSDAISSWAFEPIRAATQNGLIQGSNGKFNPQATITRAEFTKILVSVTGLDIKGDKAISFTDVTQADWFFPYVNAAYSKGFITGFNNEFNPNDKITREQMAVTIIRALGIQPAKLASEMKDREKVSAWAKAEVETIVAAALMQGSDNLFNPQGIVTREMAAVVAAKAYDYKIQQQVPDKNLGNATANKDVKNYIEQTAAFMQKAITNPIISSIGGEWTILSLARSEVKVPDAFYAKYYANVESTLKEKLGKLHNVKYTEYDRVILALTSLGKDIDHAAGYNLREPLADFDTLIRQGINGPIFALIALDSKHYEIPIVKEVKTQTTREMLIDFILKREINGGGWALGVNAAEADPDITAMAIQGLVPYYTTNSAVKAAVDRGVDWLSKVQELDGGYASLGAVNSESIAQVIVALTSLGIDPHTDPRFIKNGHSPIDVLLSFAAADGGFYHVMQGGIDNGGAKPGEVDFMATDQAMYALVAYDRFVHGLTRLYDMTDV